MVTASANTANLNGIEEAVLSSAISSISVVAGELDDLSNITSSSAATVHLSDFINWTNTGTNVDGHDRWTIGTTELWISDTCIVTS